LCIANQLRSALGCSPVCLNTCSITADCIKEFEISRDDVD